MPNDNLAETVRRLHEVIEPLLEREGFELVLLSFKRQSKGHALQLTIDRLGRERFRGNARRTGEAAPDDGVTLDDCMAVSRMLSPVLDVEDIIGDAYTLELSSPGVNRPLAKPRHFAMAVGCKVRVKTRVPIRGESFFSAQLVEADDERIVLDLRGERAEIPYRLVAKANLEFEF